MPQKPPRGSKEASTNTCTTSLRRWKFLPLHRLQASPEAEGKLPKLLGSTHKPAVCCAWLAYAETLSPALQKAGQRKTAVYLSVSLTPWATVDQH